MASFEYIVSTALNFIAFWEDEDGNLAQKSQESEHKLLPSDTEWQVSWGMYACPLKISEKSEKWFYQSDCPMKNNFLLNASCNAGWQIATVVQLKSCKAYKDRLLGWSIFNFILFLSDADNMSEYILHNSFNGRLEATVTHWHLIVFAYLFSCIVRTSVKWRDSTKLWWVHWEKHTCILFLLQIFVKWILTLERCLLFEGLCYVQRL